MRTTAVSVVLYCVGAVFLFVHTTAPFLWGLLGISASYPLGRGPILYYLSGFSPIVGAAVAFIAAETAHRKGGRQ